MKPIVTSPLNGLAISTFWFYFEGCSSGTRHIYSFVAGPPRLALAVKLELAASEVVRRLKNRIDSQGGAAPFSQALIAALNVISSGW